ncbi:pH-response regulator protein palA/RIM20 [Endocarpon pusillum Z07020]|uniref:pH-response regulator protein palA/RIM20 n=1 Tax=Endocarpon pusillum (strain Z07020 / HMAS-L-300199) TaxID=1263415 RepID=U1GEZ3_ENDPU|nr:pH-response regulator protein palA/RIM20 [Endocarpon pusillum Z07020]ERF70648.1 pH-response regulator protein palA/RIM20 [Endocarpon pusillum Z07020]
MAANILQLPFRRTHHVSLSGAIRQYISTKYEQHPEMFKEDLQLIDGMREEAISVQEPHISGIRRLTAYAAQLRWIGGKFPIDIGIDFPWYPALGFNTATPVLQNNIRFELANILYNLAALYSQLAFSTNRNSSDGLKTASQYSSAAAGVLAFLKTEVIPDMRSTPPEDMDEMTLECLEQLCLAQAQECFWQRAVKDKMKDATIARLAAKVSDFYSAAADWAIKSDAISTEWIHHFDAKHHHFAAAAQYRQSLDCLEKRKYGEEVARLRDSLACVNEALKESKWVNRTVLGDMNGLKSKVMEDLKRAEKDNDIIYLQPVPPKSELKMLDRANMVAAKTPKEVQDGISMLGEGLPFGRPLFAKLVPYAVHVAASIYVERRDRLVNQGIVAELDAMTARLRELLSSLNLPGSLQALEKPLGLPPSLVSKAEELRQQDGEYRLKRSMEDTSKLKANDQAIYAEGVELLKAEKAEDDKARAKYGTDSWSRQPSDLAGQKLWAQSTEIEGYLKSAASSDDLVLKKMRESERVLKVLTGTSRELESYVPSSRRATMTPQIEREVSRLRTCLNEVTRLESRRKRKIEALREKARSDDINPALLKETGRLEREFPMQKIEPAQFEDLFEERLQDYEVDREMLMKEQEDQDGIVSRLQDANAAFVNARKGDSSTKEREQALQELENGYLKYKEIISNLDVGRKFYNDLANIVARFRDSCKAFVNQRRMEASHLESEISTSAMSAMRIHDTSATLQRQKHHEASRPPPPQSLEQEPLTAPQPTRASIVPPGPTAGMWTPEMGIKFGPPAQGSHNPHVAPYPQARPNSNAPWDQSRPRFT